jgi:hypothetical protein
MLFIGVKRFCVIGALSVSAIFAAYDAWLFLLARTPEAELFDLHSFVLTTLVATWVVADNKEANRARPSFDHGWFIFVAFPFYVPYYLISTRRWRRGLLILGGIALLFVLPWLAEVLVWLAEWFVWLTRWLVYRLVGLAQWLLWVMKLLVWYVS